MRKIWQLALAAAMSVTLVACGGAGASSGDQGATQQQEDQQPSSVEIKQSPDKYTWYLKQYVGMNAASVGYESMDGFRRDAYGAGALKIVFVADDGTYIDPGNEEQLKNYVVTGQSLDPNTEIKYTFEVDSNGEEYDSLVNSQSIDEVVLAVNKVGEDSSGSAKLTSINPSPDKYTHYVRDYVGRNLAECGYYSLSGNLTDAYGHGYIFLDIVADDGSYIDPEDTAQLAEYMVAEQSVAPNTEITFTYTTDSEGNEYSNLVSQQSLKSMTLRVTKAPSPEYPVGEDSASEGAN